MMDIHKYIVKADITIREAIIALNALSSDALTLFVIDRNDCMIGTVTDGDIRRYLVGSTSLDDSITLVAHRNFCYLEKDKINVSLIRKYRSLGITLLPCLDKEKHIIDIYNLRKYKSILPIDAVLMAGGKGERLRPLTEKTPKPLLPVGSKAIIDYNVDSLISYGIEHVSVTVNYLHEQLESHFQTKRNTVKIDCIREPNYLGTIGSVKYLSKFYNYTILVMNSDLFTNINYEDFYLHFEEHNADMSVAAVPYSISVPYGIFELEGREIHGIKEKPTYNYYVNAGIYLIKTKLLERMPDDVFFNATDFIEMLIREGMKVVRFPITGYWIDIGKHEDYRRAQELVRHL